MKQEFPRRGCEGHHFQLGRFSLASCQGVDEES